MSTRSATQIQARHGNVRTPWGSSDHKETPLPNGIYFVSTPSHGGYFVPKKVLGRIPPEHQAYAAKWSGSPQWYEEDVAYNCVYVAFPEFFTADQVAAAKVAIAKWITPCVVCGEAAVEHSGASSAHANRTACATFTERPRVGDTIEDETGWWIIEEVHADYVVLMDRHGSTQDRSYGNLGPVTRAA